MRHPGASESYVVSRAGWIECVRWGSPNATLPRRRIGRIIPRSCELQRFVVGFLIAAFGTSVVDDDRFPGGAGQSEPVGYESRIDGASARHEGRVSCIDDARLPGRGIQGLLAVRDRGPMLLRSFDCELLVD